MTRPGRLAVLVVAAMTLVAGCGGVGPSIGAPPARATWQPGSQFTYDKDLRYACGSFAFEPSFLDQEGHAEMDEGPMADALRAHLATPGLEYETLPDAGWLLAGANDRRAEYVAPVGDGRLAQVDVENSENGWKVSGWGSGCRPSLDYPDGLGSADWLPNPKHPAPDATTRTLNVLVTERSCASAASSVGRVVGPAIRFADDRVLVAFGVIPQAGDAFECPSNPATPIVLDLGEPLGDRILVDAALLPYLDVRTVDPGYHTVDPAP